MALPESKVLAQTILNKIKMHNTELVIFLTNQIQNYAK